MGGKNGREASLIQTGKTDKNIDWRQWKRYEDFTPNGFNFLEGCSPSD